MDKNKPVLNIGARVAAAREDTGLTQADLAERLGFKDRQTLSAIESGKRKLSPEELISIMEITGKDLDFFANPFRLDEEAAFSFRTSHDDPEQLAKFEQSTANWLGLYQKLSPTLQSPANPFGTCLKLSHTSSYEDADAAAEWLIADWKLGSAPAKLMIRESLQNLKNLQVFYVDAPDEISGAACRLTGLDVILINRRDNPCRRNFDFAHELFHILTWDRMTPARVDLAKNLTEEGKKIEKLANKFASRLLMPKASLAHQWEIRDENETLEDNLLKIAAYFEASTQAVFWRLVNDGHLEMEAVIAYRNLPENSFKDFDRPAFFSDDFINRLHSGLSEGRLSVRKAARILELSIDELADLFLAHQRKPPFDL